MSPDPTHTPRVLAPLTALLLAVSSTRAAAPPRADALGDPLPEGALVRLGTVRLRHGDCAADNLWTKPRPSGKVRP